LPDATNVYDNDASDDDDNNNNNNNCNDYALLVAEKFEPKVLEGGDK